MDLQRLEQIMSDKNAGVSALGMRKIDQFMKDDNTRLKKDKVEIGKAGKRIFSLELRLPFHPFNPEDDNFSLDNPFLMPVSPTSSVLYIKRKMAEDDALKAFYAKLGGMAAEDYNISDLEKVTDQDKLVFSKYRRVLHYSLPVQRYNFSGFGKFGRKGLSTVKYDDLGNVAEKDLGYQIYELEMALASQKVDQIRADYSEGGSKFGKPEKDMKEEIKAAWKGMLVSNPYNVGSIRYLVFPTNMEYDFEEKADDIIAAGFRKYEKYGTGNKNEVTKIEGVIGTKFDTNFDYVEVDIAYPQVNDVPEAEKILTTYQRRDFLKNPSTRINSYIPGFDEKYREFRDNTDIFSEKAMLRSVYEYRAVDDDVLIEQYKADLGQKKDLITAAVADRYSALIAQVDTGLSEELLNKLMDDALPAGSEEVQDLDIENMASEDQVGFGIEIGDEIPGSDAFETIDLDKMMEDEKTA